MIELLRWLPLIPAGGFLTLALAGGRLSKTAVAGLGVGSVAGALLLTMLAGLEFLHGSMQPVRLTLGSWLAVDDLSLAFGFYLDALSLTMLAVVTGVGLLIHCYAAGFMWDDPGYARFFAYLNLFVAAMLVLVLADNLALLYLGWEGVGLGSYLLIGFWYENPDNGYAARKAFVMTRIGDTALLLGLLLLFTQFNTLDIQALMASAGKLWTPDGWLPVTTATLLLGGALGKSAQLPLQSWLPDAMAGPTPVSALIHAATMVTAGVYLIARTQVLFTLAPPVQGLVAVLGAVGLLMAGCSALAQTDIKRILAYSTISQIGYMFLALGVGAGSAAIFHLLTHAFFKALLFLAAGVVIFCFHHEHDIFKMGGLRKTLPLAFWSFMIGAAALSGLPLTAGFYSKHEILLAAFQASPGLWAAGCLGAALTGWYSFRLVFVVFFGPASSAEDRRLGWAMSLPLLALAGLALFGAMLRIPLATVMPESPPSQPAGALVAAVTTTAPALGVLLAAWLYLPGAPRFAEFAWTRRLADFFRGGWGVDALYAALAERPFAALARANKNDVLNGLPAGLVWLGREGHLLTKAAQTGRIRWYAGSLALGAAAMIALGWWS